MIEPEDTDIQRLIRLKRYEQPPEDFVDDFLIRFQHRQRSEILRQSSVSLFWERLMTFMEGRVSPGMSLAGAAAAVLIAGSAVFWMPHGGNDSSAAAAKPAPVDGKGQLEFSASPQFSFAQDQAVPPAPPERLASAIFLSQHFEGGLADVIQADKAHGRLQMQQDGRLDAISGAPFLDHEHLTSSSPVGGDGRMGQNGSELNIQRQ